MNELDLVFLLDVTGECVLGYSFTIADIDACFQMFEIFAIKLAELTDT